MALFWKLVGLAMVSVILILTVSKQEKPLALVLSMAACILVTTGAVSCWGPVAAFLGDLGALGGMSTGFFTGLLRLTGIALVSELAGHICQDSGNAALGRSVQLLGTAMILQLSLPVLQELVELFTDILGGL